MNKKKKKALALTRLISNTFAILAGILVLIELIGEIDIAYDFWDYFDCLIEAFVLGPVFYVALGVLALVIIARLFIPRLLNILYDDDEKEQ